MDLAEFLEYFEKSRFARQMLTCYCECEITYSGRAEAYLPRGDRLIVIKQDGVFLIHQPEGGNPINYLKAGGELSAELLDDRLVIRGKYVPNKEFLDVELFTVHDAMRRKLEDGQKQTLTGNEADMSDMLANNPSLLGDFRPIAREEYTDMGFIDVFGHDGNGNLVVVECKRYTAGLAAVTQLHRYVEKVRKVKGATVTGIMAAPKITANALEMLQQFGYTFTAITPPKRHERHSAKQTSLRTF